MLLLKTFLNAGILLIGSASWWARLIWNENRLILDILVLILCFIVGEKIDPRPIVGIERVLTDC